MLTVSFVGHDPQRRFAASIDALRKGQYRAGLPNQSGFAPENLTTFAHFSVSSAISLPKSAGEPGSGVPPNSASRALILGSTSPALISLLSLSMIPAAFSIFVTMNCPFHPRADAASRAVRRYLERDRSARNLVDLPDQTLTIAGEFDVLKLRCVPGMPMVYAATLRLDFCALAASAFEICPTRTAKSISRAA